MTESIVYESIVYPGPEGSHTAAAALSMHPVASLVPLAGFRAVADAVAAAEAAEGVLPIESSLAGPVAETVLPIRHCLAGPADVPLSSVRVVRSHPMAFDQCRDLLAQLSHATAVAVSSTAEAARQSAECGDETEVAIVAADAAALYGLTVIADDVGDHTAFTRFVSIGRQTRLDVAEEVARTAFSFVTKHEPGALYAAIEPFARAGLDLQRLVSRPLPATPWKYRFDAVVAGHPLDPVVRGALRDVKALTRELRVVGVYEGYEEGQ